MKNPMRLLLALLAAAIAAGCCPCRRAPQRAHRPLAGTEWRLVQLGGRTVTPRADAYTLTFYEEGLRVSGLGACNRLRGSYAPGEKGRLRIGPLASTRLTCPDEAAERDYVRTLEQADAWATDGDMLLLLSEGVITAVFEAGTGGGSAGAGAETPDASPPPAASGR